LLGLTFQDIDDILDYICSVASCHQVYYLWRPFLPDPQDDMVLELAVEAECDYIVTFNRNDFRGVEKFGIQAVTPHVILKEIGAIP
jgi:predicted nucleic acid-binding protein